MAAALPFLLEFLAAGRKRSMLARGGLPCVLSLCACPAARPSPPTATSRFTLVAMLLASSRAMLQRSSRAMLNPRHGCRRTFTAGVIDGREVSIAIAIAIAIAINYDGTTAASSTTATATPRPNHRHTHRRFAGRPVGAIRSGSWLGSRLGQVRPQTQARRGIGREP